MSNQSLRKYINKGFLKLPSVKKEVEKFKENIDNLLSLTAHQINESEEFHKNNLITFLNDSFYSPNHYLNTKGNDDLVIYNGKDLKSSVGIIIEVKKPTNKSEMISYEKFNNKSLQQLLFYYLQERVNHKNIELKHLIITNIYDWFVFPAELFERLFYRDKSLLKKFDDFNQGRLTGKSTDFFYKEIAQIYIDKVEQELRDNVAYLNLQEYHHVELNSLNDLYKFLSPYHLLKLPFSNDSNSLDEGFYSELLHIIGLTEIKEGSKKVIRRLPLDKRLEGTLLENTINQLKTYNKLDNVEKIDNFGTTEEEQLFNVALELVITWINRILFLKLLEAQLITYNRNSANDGVNDNTDYSFLNSKFIENFDDLDILFFQVLARKNIDRTLTIQEKYYHIPYLNSSLFEITDLEKKTGAIALLNYNKNIDYYSNTVLKDSQGKKETGEINTLSYLLNFLGAYDFSSEGNGDIKEDNKRLINASVLGLIFEKINGYQDGSYFTPGFITMYMCKETIRRAIINKFNQTKGWQCNTIIDLYNKINNSEEANRIINSIKICDPAVGSGHFLVSALNEILAVKSELEILVDKQGKRLKNYHITVENDELIITDEDNQLFTYNPLNPESQRIQETLFHEKQTIIENSLFGVDININSVKICRLRLWIELLKHAYYIPETQGQKTLETLPNIDINIKCGNSLISRFAINDSLTSPKTKRQISDYKEAVKNYYRPENRRQKQEITKLIKLIKDNLSNEITGNDPTSKKLRQLEGELNGLINQQSLLEESVKEKKAKEKKIKQLEKQVNKLQLEIDDKKHNRIYRNAFEWRFEFPEVLNDNGDFIGFDIIIGNPPYIRQEEFSPLKPLLKQRYQIYNSIADLLTYFVELAYNLLCHDGMFQFIISNKFTRANYGKEMRSFLLANTTLTHFIDFSGLSVFDEATVDAAILGYQKNKLSDSYLIYADVDKDGFRINDFHGYLDEVTEDYLQDNLTINSWAFESAEVLKIKQKIEAQGTPLKDWDISINYGIKTGYNEAFIIDGKKRQELIEKDSKSADIIKPLLRGRDIQKYYPDFQDLWLIGTFPSKKYNIDDFVGVKEYLLTFGDRLHQSGKKGSRKKTANSWFETSDNIAYWEDFEKPKIIYPNMTKYFPFFLDIHDNYYHNDKSFHIITNQIFWLISFLNSKLFYYCFRDNFSELLGGTRELRKVFMEQIPVQQITEKEEKPFKKLVTKIMEMKKKDKEADTKELEEKIDQLVYKLYGLTEEEIKIVEGQE
ncbi:MAG: class I SAM-dependent DNA methyltransferase [Cyanobacterium sp.]